MQNRTIKSQALGNEANDTNENKELKVEICKKQVFVCVLMQLQLQMYVSNQCLPT